MLALIFVVTGTYVSHVSPLFLFNLFSVLFCGGGIKITLTYPGSLQKPLLLGSKSSSELDGTLVKIVSYVYQIHRTACNHEWLLQL
jgi:hypothetical protein